MFSEKILEDMLFEALESKNFDFLKERGLDLYSPKINTVKRQVSMGKYGIADIVTSAPYRSGEIFLVTAIELKVSAFCSDHLGQLKRYLSALAHFNSMVTGDKRPPLIEYHGILICSNDKIKNADDYFLLNLMDFNIKVYTYEFDLKLGIKFSMISHEDALWRRSNTEFTDFKDILNLVEQSKDSYEVPLETEDLDAF